MAKRKMAALALDLDDEPDPKKWPKNLTAAQCEQVECRYRAPTSGRSIRERWGLTWYRINGKAVVNTLDYWAESQRRFDSAPISGDAEPPRERRKRQTTEPTDKAA